MGKYQISYEEKITIIKEHEENHKTLKAICEEYDISKSYLCYILRDYPQNGNACAENFFSMLKTECIYRAKPQTFDEAKELVDEYIYFYNNERIQLKTGQTPMKVRYAYAA